jgi:hypothetical protein
VPPLGFFPRDFFANRRELPSICSDHAAHRLKHERIYDRLMSEFMAAYVASLDSLEKLGEGGHIL